MNQNNKPMEGETWFLLGQQSKLEALQTREVRSPVLCHAEEMRNHGVQSYVPGERNKEGDRHGQVHLCPLEDDFEGHQSKKGELCNCNGGGGEK